MRSKPLSWRSLISLFVAAAFVVAVTPGSMGVSPATGKSMMADCPFMITVPCDHMKAHQEQGTPCKNAGGCLGMLSCYGMAALGTDQVALISPMMSAVPAPVHEIWVGLTIPPDNRPPIA
jgi:hypothetical protein